MGTPKGAPGPYAVTEPDELEKNPILQSLRATTPGAIIEALTFRGEMTLVVSPVHLRRVAELLQAEPGMQFNFLSDITAVDRFPLHPRFELNYQLLSLGLRQALRLRVALTDSKNPQIESMTPVWPTANWLEREIFDLFGIRFLGHPDLRRIVMPDSWEGYPLRKDFPVEGFR